MTEQDVIDQELTEQQMLDFISDMFINQMPFNDLLGMRITYQHG